MTTLSVCCQKHHERTLPTPVSPSSTSRPAVFVCLMHISPLNANESSSVVCYSSSVGNPKVLLWFVTVHRVFELRQRLGSDLSSLRYGPSRMPVPIKSLPFSFVLTAAHDEWTQNIGCQSSDVMLLKQFLRLVIFISLVDLLWNVCVNLTIWFCVKNTSCAVIKDTNRTTLQQLSHIFIIYYMVPLHTGYIYRYLPQILK